MTDFKKQKEIILIEKVQEDTPKRFLTAEEAAKYLGVSKRTVSRLGSEGILKKQVIPTVNKVFYDIEELNALYSEKTGEDNEEL